MATAAAVANARNSQRGLTSPVDPNARPERADAGKDYGNVKSFNAVGGGVISQIYQGLSGFGTTIIEKLTTPAAGPGGTPEDYIYYAAENSGLSPTVKSGQSVQQGQKLASGPGASGGVEAGFWDPSAGRAVGRYTEGGPATPEANAFVADISGKAPMVRPDGSSSGGSGSGSDVSKIFTDYQSEINMDRTAPTLKGAGWSTPFQWWWQSFTGKWNAEQASGGGGGSDTGPSSGGGGPAPGGISADKKAAIDSALNKYGVPSGVFYGMYEEETSLGSDVTSSSTGAVGPFQFEPGTASSYHYPLTNSPSPQEFQQQADAAAHLLSDLRHQTGGWSTALAAYNAGPGNIGAGAGYARRALAWASSRGLPIR